MVNNGGNIAKLADELSDERHAALITSDISRRYFCGFTSSAGIILVTKEASYLLIDFRYFDKAKERVSDCEVILLENAKTQLMNLLIKHGITTVSVESDAMTVTELEKYKANYTFVTFDSSCGLSEMIGKMRIIKTPEEIEKIVKAQRIAERAFSRLLRDIKPGQTEKHVAALLEYYMAEYGSDGKSFDTIAASGVNSASPHAVPTDKKLENGDFLTLDFGATYDGYHSDMTRTIAIGKVTDDMKKMFKALLFPIWLVLEVIVFVLKLMMVLSSTVLGILLRILIPMAFVAMLLSVRNGLMLLAFAWLISPIGLPWVADRVVFGLDDLCCAVKGWIRE